MKWLLAFFFPALSFCAQAQTNRIIDSLEKVAGRQRDTNLIKTYNELTWQYRLVNGDKALDYGQKAVTLSQQFRFDKGLAQAYNDMGIIYYDRQNFTEALSLYAKAMEVRRRQGDIIGIARLYNKIGIVYQRQGNFDKALENQLSALTYFESKGDDFGVSYSLNNIGIVQQNLGRLDEAIRYQERSIAMKEKLGDRIGLAGSYVNIGNVYTINQNYNQAKNYFEKAISISRQLNNREYLSNALNNLSNLYSKTERYADALPLAKESYGIRQGLGDVKGMVSCLNNIGFIHYSLKQNDEAEQHYEKALQLASGQAACKPELPSLYKNMSLLYERSAPQRSLALYKLYADAKDSLFTSDLNARFAELQTKYETLEKEKKIALLNKDNSIKALEIRNQQLQIRQSLLALTQNKLELSEANLELSEQQLELQEKNERILKQRYDSTNRVQNISALTRLGQIQQLEIDNRKLQLNRRNVLISALLVVMVLTVLLGYLLYRRRQLKSEARIQAEVLRQQELATRAVLEAEEAERQRIAKDLHDGVGQMMSAAKMNLSAYEHGARFDTNEDKHAFERIIALVDESCREVRSVSHNMMPNALLKNSLAAAIREFIDKLDQRSLKVHLYTEGLEARLCSNTETVLYRVIQECVNNVIKHSGANTLDISIIRDANEITATIEDNGKGFETTNASEGMGLKNIRTRVEYLKGAVDFDSTPGKGTLVALHIPL